MRRTSAPYSPQEHSPRTGLHTCDRMAVRCVILDFDGTFTDIETEAQPFVPAFRREVESRIGSNATRYWENAERTVDESPDAYGWESEGVIVAPATADPYIRATVIAQTALKEAEQKVEILLKKAGESAVADFTAEESKDG